MKKLLTLLMAGIVTLSASISVISCGDELREINPDSEISSDPNYYNPDWDKNFEQDAFVIPIKFSDYIIKEGNGKQFYVRPVIDVLIKTVMGEIVAFYTGLKNVRLYDENNNSDIDNWKNDIYISFWAVHYPNTYANYLYNGVTVDPDHVYFSDSESRPKYSFDDDGYVKWFTLFEEDFQKAFQPNNSYRIYFQVLIDNLKMFVDWPSWRNNPQLNYGNSARRIYNLTSNISFIDIDQNT